jgi:hypothetical protein
MPDNTTETNNTPKSIFDTLSPKALKASGAHRISPEAQVVDGRLIVALPLDEIGKSKPSSGEKGSVGFMFNPVTFEFGGKTFQINPGWTTLTAK